MTRGQLPGRAGHWPAPGRARAPASGRPHHRLAEGIVTVEVAFMTIALAFFLAVSATALATGVDHVRCAEAARVGARLAARSEPAGDVVTGALDTAPGGSRVDVARGGSTVTVTVRAPERAFFARIGFHFAGVGRAVAPTEVRGHA